MKILFIIVLVVLFPFKDLAADSTFRCSGGIVSVGETKLEVSAKCGRPDRVESWEEGGGRYYFQIYDYEHERYVLPKLLIIPHPQLFNMNPSSFCNPVVPLPQKIDESFIAHFLHGTLHLTAFHFRLLSKHQENLLG